MDPHPPPPTPDVTKGTLKCMHGHAQLHVIFGQFHCNKVSCHIIFLCLCAAAALYYRSILFSMALWCSSMYYRSILCSLSLSRSSKLLYKSIAQCFSTFFASRPKMSTVIWARPQPLNTPTSVLYVGEFGQHFSVRSFFKKLVDSRATPRKSLGDPKWGSRPRGWETLNYSWRPPDLRKP